MKEKDITLKECPFCRERVAIYKWEMSNYWSYNYLVKFAKEYFNVCCQYPYAKITVSR